MDIYKYVMTAPEKSTLMLDEYQVEELRELVARLEALNADLLAVCEAAEKEINKIMHAAFISSTYRGRMNDIRAAAESARKIVAAAAVKVRGE